MVKNFFKKVKESLQRTRTQLMGSLSVLFGGTLTDEVLDEVEEALYEADMGVHVTEMLVEKLRDNAGDINRGSISAFDVLKETLRDVLGEPQSMTVGSKRPHVILVVGVNGVGKTTTIGKLAMRFRQEGHSVLLAACDTFRAAAVEQLSIWAERSGSDFISSHEGADPASVAFDAINRASSRSTDVVIIDTAGRLHTAKNLMEELKKIQRVIQRVDPEAPHETLLVLDATTGQNALNQAEVFDKALDVSGIALTKLDGTAKGGIIISIVDKLSIPVRLIGVGEGIDHLRDFDPETYLDALFDLEQNGIHSA